MFQIDFYIIQLFLEGECVLVEDTEERSVKVYF